MKKLLGISFLIAFTTGGFMQANAQEEVSDPIVEITCPSGDDYRCYTTESGVTAYKGEGEAKVVIKPV